MAGSRTGTIVIDPDAAILHFVETPERAMHYGVSVGAAGFRVGRDGTASVPPCVATLESALDDDGTISAELEPYSVANGGIDPGPGNSLGARALYLFQNGVDTLYRIHGDASARELGQAVSSGCIRMLDQDVIDLHDQDIHGASGDHYPAIEASRVG